MTATLLTGDALTVLRTLPDGAARCCVTSPPYWGLRDYGHAGQLGLERTPEEYVAGMVAVFREVRRVLADDGTLWLNLGDSYTGGTTGRNDSQSLGEYDRQVGHAVGAVDARVARRLAGVGAGNKTRLVPDGLKPKDLVGIPWRVAFALQADGWYLRSDIIWAKPNPMPESVTDRPTKAHEYLFLLSKSERYYYDADAIAEPFADERMGNPGGGTRRYAPGDRRDGTDSRMLTWNKGATSNGRNARTVWTIATQPYAEAHFATFPEELARRCIVAGSAPTDTVLDPFSGSGTVAAVAVGNGRAAIGIELNPKYQDLARHRIGPMLCGDAA